MDLFYTIPDLILCKLPYSYLCRMAKGHIGNLSYTLTLENINEWASSFYRGKKTTIQEFEKSKVYVVVKHVSGFLIKNLLLLLFF